MRTRDVPAGAAGAAGDLSPDYPTRGIQGAALLRSGAVAGLSFGYRVVKGARDAKTGLRELTDLDLLEVSLVTFPMQPLARVHAVEPPAEA